MTKKSNHLFRGSVLFCNRTLYEFSTATVKIDEPELDFTQRCYSFWPMFANGNIEAMSL